MIQIEFAPSFQKHVPIAKQSVDADCVREALETIFQQSSQLRGYVLDDQGMVRKHVTVFVNHQPIRDRLSQGDRLQDGDQVFVFQLLSGG